MLCVFSPKWVAIREACYTLVRGKQVDHACAVSTFPLYPSGTTTPVMVLLLVALVLQRLMKEAAPILKQTLLPVMSFRQGIAPAALPEPISFAETELCYQKGAGLFLPSAFASVPT